MIAPTIRVLLVEDVAADAELEIRELKRAGLRVASRIVDRQDDFVAALREFAPDVILSDFSMPGFDGMEALALAREISPDTPFVFVSGTIGEEYAIRALKSGATDYVIKSNLVRLPAAVTRALDDANQHRERRRAEAALDVARDRLREREAGLRRAQVMAKLGHVITGVDGVFESWSETLPPLIGVEPSRLPKSTRAWLDMLHPDDRERFRSASIEAAVKGNRVDVEYRLQRPDGAWMHIRQVIEPLQRQSGAAEPARWFSTLQDVTVEKRAGQELRESESLKGAILESSLDALITIDRQGNIVEFNPAAEAIFGIPRQRALGKVMAELIIPPRLREAHYRGFAHYLTTGEGPILGKRLELQAIRADGTEFPIELAIRAINTGSEPLFTGFIRDITTRKEAETRIVRLNRVYAVLSGINALIVRVRGREELLKEACRIAVQAGQFPVAFVAVADPREQLVKVVASAGDERGLAQFTRPTAGAKGQGKAGLSAQAIEKRAPVIVNDIEADSGAMRYAKEALERGFRSVAALPLVVEGTAVGALVLYSAEAGFFDDEETRLLVELAGNISFALDHIEKEEKVRRLTRVHGVLTGINAAIVRIRDRDELFRESCRIAVQAGQFPLAWIAVVDPRRQLVKAVASAGDERGFVQFTRPTVGAKGQGKASIGAQAIEKRIPVICDDIEADGSIMQYPKEALERGFRSAAALPLVVEGTAIGALMLYAAEAGFFDDEERRLLVELAGNISFALEHIDKEEKVRRLTRVHAVLSGINAAIVRVRERHDLFQEACRIAIEHGKFRMAWVGLVDPSAGLVKPVASAGEVGNFFESAPLAVTETKPGGHGLAGRAVRDMKPVISNDVLNDPQRLMKKELEDRGIKSLAIIPLLVGSEAIGVLALYAAEIGAFDDEEMRLLVELAGDISFALEHIDKAEKLDYLAYYDQLTGLANRTLFYERVEQLLAAAALEGRKIALVILDVERFKTINDSLGRQEGDALLKQIAERMSQNDDGSLRVARISSDHFAVVGRAAQSEDEVARRVERRMQRVFGPPFRVGDTELRITAKAGIALYPNDGSDPDTLFRNAESALKRAKAQGERYLFYTAQMTERVAEKLALENKLRQALEKDEFILHYQPKVDLERRSIVGVEALIRWQSPELGLVPPLQFIPLLEETGLIQQVGSWALRRASLDHRSWVEQGLKAPRVAVNVSPIQLRQRIFVEVIEHAIMEGVVPTAIDLEITESLIMEDIQGNIQKLNAVRALGVSIAIDDFGTGYSSLGYLAKLPVQSLKIDRSFITAMHRDANTMTLVSTIVSLAHSLRLKVVAEGVETEEQAKILRLLRCDEMQGYLFSKPLPMEGLVELLRKT
jgi:diguanylate cyclase (GGDEF)-like protein/PAS domain S-box-containing protein